MPDSRGDRPGLPPARRPQRVAGQRRPSASRRTGKPPVLRRASTWVIGAVLAGAAAGISTLVSNAVSGGVHTLTTAVGGGSSGGPAQIDGSGSASASASGPIQLEYVGAVRSLPNGSFVLSGTPSITSAQLAEADRLNNSGSASEHDQLVASLHGVSPSDGTVEITVRGAASGTVTITGMDVVKQCGAPLTGTLFYSPSGGEDTSVNIGFDLDSPISSAQVEQEGSFSGSFFGGKVITLQPGETDTLNVTVGTRKHFCTFYFELHIASADGSATEKIDENGQPFAITAIPKITGPGGIPVVDFASYSAVYAGGLADDDGGEESGAFIQVNPKTYAGIGNPASFPPPR